MYVHEKCMSKCRKLFRDKTGFLWDTNTYKIVMNNIEHINYNYYYH